MKYFENAEMEIISFNVADVITTSGVGDFKVDENGAIDSELDFVNTLSGL